jgi:spore germination cell wall hydrolase CwlJ-like protein
LTLGLVLAPGAGTAFAADLTYTIVPATLSPAIAQIRATTPPVDAPPALTPRLLQAYVARQQKLRAFNGFYTQARPKLTEAVLMSYIARRNNPALQAIANADHTSAPVLTQDVLADYAQNRYVPTVKRVKHVSAEELCLTQAIYHEARGESEDGQMAVANIIINRALSRKYPSTICGVVFQNADNGLYHCQFTFACDGRSDMGTERRAWARAVRLADIAFREFQKGQRPGILPSNALFYHTAAVAPRWSNSMRRVAAIGAHIFYAAH